MQMTLQCHYCGNEDHKLDMQTPADVLEQTTIKCKCGRFLVRDGVMGHKDNVRVGDRVKYIKRGLLGKVHDESINNDKVYVKMDGIEQKKNYFKHDLEVITTG